MSGRYHRWWANTDSTWLLDPFPLASGLQKREPMKPIAVGLTLSLPLWALLVASFQAMLRLF